MDANFCIGEELRTHLSNCDLNLFLHPSSTSLPSSPLFHPSFPFPDPALFTEKKIFFSFFVYVQFEDIDIEDKLDCFFVKWLKLDCSKLHSTSVLIDAFMNIYNALLCSVHHCTKYGVL